MQTAKKAAWLDRWRGEHVCIAANGPSLRREDIDFAKSAGCKVIAVNNAWQLAEPDILYACDGKWWDVHGGVPGFDGEKWTQDKQAARQWRLEYVPSADLPGICTDNSVIHRGSNGGYQAINLAVLFGVRRIVLLGFDMGLAKDGARHWFGDHPTGLNNPQAHDFARWRTNFASMVPDLAKAGVEVVNCSRQTQLECFPTSKLDAVEWITA